MANIWLYAHALQLVYSTAGLFWSANDKLLLQGIADLSHHAYSLVCVQPIYSGFRYDVISMSHLHKQPNCQMDAIMIM